MAYVFTCGIFCSSDKGTIIPLSELHKIL